MRIVQVHWAFPPTTGGVESHVADLSADLAARGCDVTVITGEERPEARAGVTLVSAPSLNLERIRRGEDIDHRDLGRAIASLHPDVVHGHNLHHFSTGPAVALDALQRELGFALHHTFHETWPDLLHERPVYRNWARNYAVSCHVGDECEARIGFRPEVRPLGVDVDRFRSTRSVFSHDGTARLLHPARLLPWKGVHVSVEAVATLRDRGVPVHLTITDTARIADWEGELADYRRRIIELIEQLGVRDRVALVAASYVDMPELYDRADVVLYPTLAAEPYGLVPLEAMSARRPVVASRCGGIPETVVDGVTGLLVEPGDAVELADGIERLVAEPDFARTAGEAGRRRVVESFALPRYVDALLDDYRRASMMK